MNVQVVNVNNPNSIKNTSLFAVFEGDDTTTNLHTALDPYKEQVSEMQGMDWGLVSHTAKHTCTCTYIHIYMYMCNVRADSAKSGYSFRVIMTS